MVEAPDCHEMLRYDINHEKSRAVSSACSYALYSIRRFRIGQNYAEAYQYLTGSMNRWQR